MAPFKVQLAGNVFSYPEEHLKYSKIVLLCAEMASQLPNWRAEAAH